jgi:hypothetical protein
MPRKASEKSNGEKLLMLFQKLMLQRGKHYQNELAKWLGCSPQTVMRLTNEIALQVGKIWDTGVEHNRRWYAIQPEQRGKFGIDYEELRYLAICRDLAAPFLAKQVKDRVDHCIHDIGIELMNYDSRQKLNEPTFQFYSKGRIDYTPHYKTLALLKSSIDEHAICELLYKKGGEDEPKTFYFAPKRFTAISGVIYVIGVETNNNCEQLKTISIAVHRVIKIKPTIYKKEFQLKDDNPSDFGLPWHEPVTYIIRFKKGKASDYVRERIWADRQKLTQLDDGGVELELITRSGPEVEAWVRGFGDEVVSVRKQASESTNKQKEKISN